MQDGQVTWHAGTFAELLALPAAVVAVDIPIGLPSGGARRACDVAARQRLGAQRSSVFFAPPREALAARTHAEASALSRAAGGVGVSLQTWHIVDKIREVGPLADRDRRVVEVHPELSFRALTDGPFPRKALVAGREARLAALRGWLPAAALPHPRPGRAAPDDCLDALVCAWTAGRWLRSEADVLGQGVDASGRPVRIAV